VLACNTAIGRLPLDMVDVHMYLNASVVIDNTRKTIFKECKLLNVKDVCCLDWDYVDQWEMGKYSRTRDPVGTSCVEYAVNNGAEEIRIYGFEGVAVTVPPDPNPTMNMGVKYEYAAAVVSSEIWERQRSRLQTLIDKTDVYFVFAGGMKYVLRGSNCLCPTTP